MILQITQNRNDLPRRSAAFFDANINSIGMIPQNQNEKDFHQCIEHRRLITGSFLIFPQDLQDNLPHSYPSGKKMQIGIIFWCLHSLIEKISHTGILRKRPEKGLVKSARAYENIYDNILLFTYSNAMLRMRRQYAKLIFLHDKLLAGNNIRTCSLKNIGDFKKLMPMQKTGNKAGMHAYFHIIMRMKKRLLHKLTCRPYIKEAAKRFFIYWIRSCSSFQLSKRHRQISDLLPEFMINFLIGLFQLRKRPQFFHIHETIRSFHPAKH